jgi:hypothetical protein
MSSGLPSKLHAGRVTGGLSTSAQPENQLGGLGLWTGNDEGEVYTGYGQHDLSLCLRIEPFT